MHVHVKPLDHPDLIFSNLGKQRKLHQPDLIVGSSTNHSIDLTKDAEDLKIPQPSPSLNVNHSMDKYSASHSFHNEHRQSSFVRYLGEHLRQTLANESQNLSSTSMNSTTQSLLSLQQALQEQNALIQQNRREQISNIEQKIREENALLRQSRGERNSIDTRTLDQSIQQLYKREQTPHIDHRINEQTSMFGQNHRDNGNSVKFRSEKDSSVHGHQDQMASMDQNSLIHHGRRNSIMENRLGEDDPIMHHNHRDQTPNIERQVQEQSSVIHHNRQEAPVAGLGSRLREENSQVVSNGEDDSSCTRIAAQTPHEDVLKMDLGGSEISTIAKTVDSMPSRFDSQGRNGEHVIHHKEAGLPTMNIAHYNSQSPPFRPYPAAPFPTMGMALPAHLPHFPNSNVGPKMDNSVRIFPPNPIQRIMGSHHMANHVTSSNLSSASNLVDSLHFAHQK